MPVLIPSPRLSALALAAVLLGATGGAAHANRAVEVPSAMLYEPADSLEGNFLAAYIANTARDTAAASAFFREALRADPRNAELQERAFVAFLADGAMPEGFRAAERLVQRDNASGLAQLALGVRHIKAKQYATARNHLSRGSRGRAADLTSTLLTAWAHAGAGEGKKALETADRLKGDRSFAVFRDYHAGLIATLTGNPTEADRRFKAVYETENTTLWIVDAYGRHESSRGRRESAIAAYEAYDKLVPRNPVIRAALDRLRAGETLRPSVRTAQDGAAEVLYGLGSAGNSQGDELPTIIYLRLALHLAPEHPLALITLADTLERLKQLERANEVFAQVPKDSPIRPNAEIQIGFNLEQLGRGEEAVQRLESLLAERPNDIDVVLALGNVLRSRKRYPEAAAMYTRAVETIGQPDAGHWSVFYYRGTAYERAKDWPKAEADLKRALSLIPDSQPAGKAQVLNYLGYSWVDMGINIDEAFALLQRAVELSPRDGMIIDSLGWAYYRLGRYEEAVRDLERAVELKPGDPVINDHLGDAYWKVGRRLEARFQWSHARDSSPEPDDLAKILRKLEVGIDEDKPAAAENGAVEPQKNGG